MTATSASPIVDTSKVIGKEILDEINRQRPDVDAIRSAIRLGADLTVMDAKGYPALMHVTSWGNIGLLKEMLDNGAKVNQPGLNGSTAMHIAVAGGNEQVIDLYLSHGGNVALRNKVGNAPFDFAHSPALKAKLQDIFNNQDPDTIAARKFEAALKSGLKVGKKVRANVPATFGPRR